MNSRPLSENLSLKAGPLPQTSQEVKHLGLLQQDQDSSLTRSTDQSHKEVSPIQGANSQDQCISSDSGKDESSRKHVESRIKPVPLMAHVPYVYGDPFINGLYTAYGPPAIMIGIAPSRVLLPPDIAEDGPIYVNAKQYNGILRRRQIRAKLEAQNKLVKNRKPYLHESRHLHALNRVRGSGGRFLNTKRSQQSDSTPPPASPHHALDSGNFCELGNNSKFAVHQLETGKCEATTSISSIDVGVIDGDVIFQQQEYRFSNISSLIGGNGRVMCNGGRHCAPGVM